MLGRVANSLLARLSPDEYDVAARQMDRRLEGIAYRRLVKRGFKPAGIIDVGAFEGGWTRQTQDIFGKTPALMVEAQPAKRAILEQVSAEMPHVAIAMSPLSGKSGEEITFYEMGTGSSFLAEQSNVSRVERRLVTRTLDEVSGEALPGRDPLFLKIDVQGAELHVLAGGAQTLKRCELVQLELAMVQYNEGAPLLPEVVAYMAARDFLPIEVSGFSRPRDVLVQIDMIFARADSSLRPTTFAF